MEYNIAINSGEPTDISQLKNGGAVVRCLTLSGAGKLDACMVTFYKRGDSITAQKDLLFLKPLHEKSEVLLPHIKDFPVSDFDFCQLEVFTGNVLKSDKVQLSLTSKKVA